MAALAVAAYGIIYALPVIMPYIPSLYLILAPVIISWYGIAI